MIRNFTHSLSITLSAIFMIAVGFGLAVLVVPQLSGTVASAIDEGNPTQPIAVSDGAGLLLEQGRIFADLYERVAPSVVAITVAEEVGLGIFDPSSSGSGFVIDADGHIVTNSHVVASGDLIEIRFFNGTIAEAEIIGMDFNADIAVLKVDLPSDSLTPIGFADSDALTIGQTVIAMGNPFQNDWTLTSGIISALNRSIPSLDNRFSIGGVIQTDAAINPGNSGGPLVDLRGRVIGVNSQIESVTRSNSGVGFAAPSNLVAKVAQQLIATGTVEYSFIGIGSNPIDLSLIQQYDLPNNIQGVPVRTVEPNSPAATAGLAARTDRTIDIITAIDGTPVADFDELIGYLGINTDPGDAVTFTIYRGGDIIDLQVTLTTRPE